jgi:DNA repair protein RecN (Recombination protein N)
MYYVVSYIGGKNYYESHYMLLSLHIRDFVIVDQLTLHVNTGFTVLTGETGAGKSILIDALGLLLGARAEVDMVRAGREKADLSAEFTLPSTPALSNWLAEECLQNTDAPQELIVRRIIDVSGRSKAFINGIVVPVAKLKEVSHWLLDIHGQHAHQQLLREDAQRQLLDAYNKAQPLVMNTRQAYRDWQTKKQRRQAAELHTQESAVERERLTWQITEVEALQFNAQEWETLNQMHHRLHHAASLIEGVQKALYALSEGENSCQSLIASETHRLQHLQAYDDGLAETVSGLNACEAELNEAIYALQRYADKIEIDPMRLAEVENRMQQVWSMARKYRLEPEALPDVLQTWQTALAQLETLADPVRLQAEEEAAQAAYQQLAQTLSRQRAQGAKVLAEKVTHFMQLMAMQGSRFEVSLLPTAQPQAYGLENIEYRVAPHAGAELKAMSKVASGGELSRISLALQVATSEVARVPTLIFDEVDVGIGGGVAEVVGQLLKQLGQQYQVLCITHLPQVAACGDQQLQVSKALIDGAVLSQIEVLDQQGRVEEIARMLGGVEITATTRQHAAEMLKTYDR